MKYLNSYEGSLTEGFFDFFKRTKPDELTIKKKKLLELITQCCREGLRFYNNKKVNKKYQSTHVVRNREKGAMYIIINDDLSVTFDGNISWYGWNDVKLPFKFNIVTGNFTLEKCYGLQSLENLPRIVGGTLDIAKNDLDSLQGLNVDVVGGNFNCRENNIQTLESLPRKVAGEIYVTGNNICNYDGISFELFKKMDFYSTPISYLGLRDFLRKNEDAFDLFKQYDPVRPPETKGGKPIIYNDRLDDFMKEYRRKLVITDHLKHIYDIQ